MRILGCVDKGLGLGLGLSLLVDRVVMMMVMSERVIDRVRVMVRMRSNGD